MKLRSKIKKNKIFYFNRKTKDKVNIHINDLEFFKEARIKIGSGKLYVRVQTDLINFIYYKTKDIFQEIISQAIDQNLQNGAKPYDKRTI
jgi:hypothetical protein